MKQNWRDIIGKHTSSKTKIAKAAEECLLVPASSAIFVQCCLEKLETENSGMGLKMQYVSRNTRGGAGRSTHLSFQTVVTLFLKGQSRILRFHIMRWTFIYVVAKARP